MRCRMRNKDMYIDSIKNGLYFLEQGPETRYVLEAF
jgi:hypothetical protein